MKTLPLSEVKMKFSTLVDSVNATDQEIVITRNGRPVAVLVSADEFDSWREFVSINADTDLMTEIRNGLAALQKKEARLYTLDELCG